MSNSFNLVDRYSVSIGKKGSRTYELSRTLHPKQNIARNFRNIHFNPCSSKLLGTSIYSNILINQHFSHAAIFQCVFPMYALTRIQETVHAKNVSQSPSPSKEAARIVSNSKWIPLETRSAVEFRNRSAKDGSVPRGQLTRGNSRPLLVGGHGITDATCVESGISYWAAGF